MRDIKDEAQGRWRGILATLGLSDNHLSGRHGPCPICQGGKDRFRFDDKGGNGTYICSVCGAGDGIKLVMEFRGWDFKTTVKEIREIIGTVRSDPVRQELSDERARELRQQLWQASRPVEKGDPVDRYLEARGIGELIYPPALRFCPSCFYSSTQNLPAMVAAIQDRDGAGVSLHRTYLGDGCKADVQSARRLMPGKIPHGAAVRLGDPGEVLGIAEGIETAMAASGRFEIPVWAAVSAPMLGNWEPPDGTKEVVVFGDNDRQFAGQAAAYTLARRLAGKGFTVSVQIPAEAGTDWADAA